jgi:hypothetical protein
MTRGPTGGKRGKVPGLGPGVGKEEKGRVRRGLKKGGWGIGLNGGAGARISSFE